MPYKYDPDDVPATDYSPIPEGEYDVIIEQAAEKTSKAGNAMMELTLAITGPSQAGRKLWDHVVYDDKAGRKFRDILRACGLPDVMQEITPDLLEGEVGTVRVRHELYQGERRAKVHYWVEAEDAPDTPPPPSADDEPEMSRDEIPF